MKAAIVPLTFAIGLLAGWYATQTVAAVEKTPVCAAEAWEG